MTRRRYCDFCPFAQNSTQICFISKLILWSFTSNNRLKTVLVQADYLKLIRSGAPLEERNRFIERHSHTLAYSYAGGDRAYRKRSKAYGQAAALRYDGRQYWMAPHEVRFGEGVIMESTACVHGTIGARTRASLGTTSKDSASADGQKRLSYDCRVLVLEEK